MTPALTIPPHEIHLSRFNIIFCLSHTLQMFSILNHLLVMFILWVYHEFCLLCTWKWSTTNSRLRYSHKFPFILTPLNISDASITNIHSFNNRRLYDIESTFFFSFGATAPVWALAYSERAKAVHTLDRSATVTGWKAHTKLKTSHVLSLLHHVPHTYGSRTPLQTVLYFSVAFC
jgi:hypothetical protein